jgi:hypothetical protein
VTGTLRTDCTDCTAFPVAENLAAPAFACKFAADPLRHPPPLLYPVALSRPTTFEEAAGFLGEDWHRLVWD